MQPYTPGMVLQGTVVMGNPMMPAGINMLGMPGALGMGGMGQTVVMAQPAQMGQPMGGGGMPQQQQGGGMQVSNCSDEKVESRGCCGVHKCM